MAELVAILLLLVAPVTRPAPPQLPNDAFVLDSCSLGDSGIPHRKLVLWMLDPEKHPTDYSADDPYTCPDETRGSYVTGIAQLSLLDQETSRVLQTISLGGPDGETLDLPYAIRPGYYYRSASPDPKVEGKASILEMKDVDGDGRALEFILFDAPACMGLQTSLVAYVPETDSVVQYPIDVTYGKSLKESDGRTHWLPYLFAHKPVAAGQWRFDVDYRGRGGLLVTTRARFDAAGLRFVAELTGVE